ncbi:MAG: hypothetical protein M3N51_04725 [Actinomycetota bacterium]|nr:hypothetical protein [Actinomycetota bacterium]
MRTFGRLLGRPAAESSISDQEWEALIDGSSSVLSVCHPDWRGVRVSARSHHAPVLEAAHAGTVAGPLVDRMTESGVGVLVVHGFPPGSERLVREAAGRGIATRCVLYSSMAQHTAEPGEAAVVDRVVELLDEGSLGRLGFAKEGQAEAFAALGVPAHFVPNRPPSVPPLERLPLGEGLQVGVFGELFWRKNVATQLGGVALMGGRAHVIWRPALSYLKGLDVLEHGLLPHQEFLRLQGSVDLNLYVTLSECLPLTPVESYASGVPCLFSRTSMLFRDDPELWRLTTVDELDNPAAIARAARHLLHKRLEAVKRARRWLDEWDEVAARYWRRFVED